jgi:transposase InsO family protein
MEIAADTLPGLPTTVRGVRMLAARSVWRQRPRAGRGGGVEYPLEALPPEARAAYVARHVEAVDVPTSIARDAASEPAAATLAGSATEARDARLAVLALADRTASEGKVGRKVADRQFCALYNGGALSIGDWIKAEVRQVTPRTLMRWRAFARDGRTARLGVDRAASRRGQGLLDRANGGEVRTYMLALIAKQPQLTAHHVRALVADRFGRTLALAERTVALPPVRTFQYALKGWRETFSNELLAIRNPDGFKSSVRFAARVRNPAAHLNQLWQIDASPADAMTTDGRHSIYVCEDIYSRRLVALVTTTARAAAVGLVLRKAMLAWGVPEIVKTDNGSDFVARETQRLLAALAISHELAPPFRPEKKGHVERAIGTLQRGLMRTLPGFIGHSVADRKVIEGRKAFSQRLGEAAEDTFEVSLSATELQQRVDNWCADVYGRAPHAGLGGRSPFEVAASAAGPIQRVDLRALDMLLAPVAGKDGIRTATKLGVRIDGAFYMAGFLDVGAEVMVRMDPADLGRAYIFERDGNAFLGEAICPDLAGVHPAAAIAAVRAEQKRLIDERMAPARAAARRIRAIDFAPAIHRQALLDAGGLVEFPKRSEAHETPAIAAARAAAEGGDLAPTHSAEVAALQSRLLAEASSSAVIPLRTEETAHHRWHRARAIEAAVACGDEVDAGELLWLGGYREGSEYRGFALTYDVPLRADQPRPVEAAR